MSERGYSRSDAEVARALAEAGFYHGPLPEVVPQLAPRWWLQPIDRWRWRRDRKAMEARVREVHAAWAAKGLLKSAETKAKP